MHTLQIATFIMATIAAVGSVVRVLQNERSYRLMRKVYKKKRRSDDGDLEVSIAMRASLRSMVARLVHGLPQGATLPRPTRPLGEEEVTPGAHISARANSSTVPRCLHSPSPHPPAGASHSRARRSRKVGA